MITKDALSILNITGSYTPDTIKRAYRKGVSDGLMSWNGGE